MKIQVVVEIETGDETCSTSAQEVAEFIVQKILDGKRKSSAKSLSDYKMKVVPKND